MQRPLPLGLGCFALPATIIAIGVDIALLSSSTPTATLQWLSIASASLEAVAAIVLTWLVTSLVQPSLLNILHASSKVKILVAFCTGLFFCTLAAAVSVTQVVHLASEISNETVTYKERKETFLIVCSIIIGISFASQLLFLITHFVYHRGLRLNGNELLDASEDNRALPRFHVKSIPYSKTSNRILGPREMASFESGSRSFMTEKTTASPRSSLTVSIRPVSLRSRLAPSSDRRKRPSLDTVRSSMDQNAEIWDVSAIYERQLEPAPQSYHPGHVKPPFLETIPASPTTPTQTSASPVPSFDLEPPRPIYQQGRSRSTSPASVRTLQAETPGAASDEMNIHPLFRSDSPTPPPAIASPGTSVVAAPDAGRVIQPRPSTQSIRTRRSGSFRSTSSALSRQTSLEAVGLRKIMDGNGSREKVVEQESPGRRISTPTIFE